MARSNELTPNMAVAYVRKEASMESRLGMEFGVQGGYDSKEFGYGQDRPILPGAATLRYFSRANISYLGPVG